MRTIVTECRRLGIRHLTLYTFSSENWSRPKAEVSALFSLLLEFLGQEVPRMEREGIRLNILGDMEALPLAARTALRHGLRRTAANTDMVLNLALNYGGRAELVRAVRSMMAEGLRPGDVTEQSLADHLYTAGQPDPDFLIRTSGEQRLSNYLLYQCAYSEFYFTPHALARLRRGGPARGPGRLCRTLAPIRENPGSKSMAVDHATDIRRTITGLILAAIVILALVLRGWVLLAIILLVAALGLWEFFSLFWGNKRIPSRICAIALGWGMLTLTWAHRTQDALVCLGAGFVLAAMSFLFRWNEVEEEGVPAFASSGIFMAGLAYIPLLLLPATYLSTTKLLFVLAAVAISDTSAYFVGTRFGHHKLWPRVSPNKSSEGAVGSLVGCVIFCTIYGACLGSASWWPSPCWGSPSMPSPSWATCSNPPSSARCM